MKINRKINLSYIFLSIIIGSHLFVLIESRNKSSLKSKLTKKNKKFRSKGEICYHSVPHWEEKNGNLPCAKGYICRPPANVNNVRKPIPFRCYDDNIQGKWKGKIHFASKKERSESESYLFEIYYPIKIKKRESSEEYVTAIPVQREGEECTGDSQINVRQTNKLCISPLKCIKKSGTTEYVCSNIIAKRNEICQQSSILNGISKNCENGLICRIRENETTLKGVDSYCLDPLVKGKLNETCAFNGQLYRECESNLNCSEKQNDKEKITNGTKYCIEPLLVGIGEVCYISTPNYPIKKCPDGYECRQKDEDKTKGGENYCLKKRNENSNILPDSIKIAGANQECSKPIPGYVQKACEAGYTCRMKESERLLKGASSYCLNVSNVIDESTPLPIGAKCSKDSKPPCPSGHICKLAFYEMSGNTYCLLPSAFDSYGYNAYVGKDNYCSETKPCGNGMRCVKVFDNTAICIANKYDNYGNPLKNRR